MSEGNNVSISLRDLPRLKVLLETAAAGERRSQTNMPETLLFADGEGQGFEVANQTDGELPAEGGAK